MTLVAAWIRRTPGTEELIVASDSRLSGGVTLDHAPKILRLDRQDAVLAYCGSTSVAYPIVLQLKAGLDAYDETRSRVLDITQLRTHIQNMIERLRSSVSCHELDDSASTGFKILLAGYSWRLNEFYIVAFKFNIRTGEFSSHRVGGGLGFHFMSDVHENEKAARNRLLKRLASRPDASNRRLNWEPLESLLTAIRDPNVYDIGGPPQIIKIYRHSNTLPINVLWSETVKMGHVSVTRHHVTHLGRALLEYEKSRYLTLELDNFSLIEPWKIGRLIDKKNEEKLNEARYAQLESLANTIKALSVEKKRRVFLNELVTRGASFDEIRPFLIAGNRAF